MSNSILYQDYVNLGGGSPLRLDMYITETLALCSRSQLKNRLNSITLNNKPAKLSQKVQSGQLLAFSLKTVELFIEKEDLNLDIIYEDENVWVINKAQGMAVHPGAGRKTGTVANALAFKLGDNCFDNQRPGIVHRLDMDTSGLLICAKTPEAHEFLARQFKNRTTQKRYMAIVDGHLTSVSGLIDNYIDRSHRHRKLFTCGEDPTRGKQAVTGYRRLLSRGKYDLVLFKPRTGRTHQLRVHSSYMGHPIVGDSLYNPKPLNHSLMLHAWKLKIVLPGHTESSVFTAPIPQRFYEALGVKKPAP